MTKLILVPQGRTSAFNVASTCTEIGDYAFYHSNANGPVIYDQVKTINTYAFSGVKSNFKVYCLKDTPTETFVKNKSISYTYAYEYTTASDGVTITKYSGPYTSPGVPTSINGKSVIAIGDEAFKGNTSVTYVYLYSPISTIGSSAFYGCTNLKRVTMPSAVTQIGDRAFYNCSSMDTLSLPSSLQKIGTYAFGYCSSLTDVTIPNSVTQLNYGSFYGCTNLTSLNIGTGLKNIGAYSFENTGLTSQYIPKNVTFIGDNAFGYKYSSNAHTLNSSFEYISGYPDTEAEVYANDNDITFKSFIEYSVSNGSVTIDKYTGSDTSVVIPSTIGGYPVTKIKSYAFNGSNVTSVTLPSSMTQIDGYAFYGASKLKSIYIPSSVTSIGSYAFEFCTSLTSINIPATVKSIGNGAFYGCTSLSSLTLNSGLQTIGKYAFTNVALTSVTVPKTVTTINEYAFAYNYANSTYTAVSGFTMTGYVDTAAETYANNNTHITFKPQYETLTNTSTVDKTSITLGGTVKVTAGATGGKKPYEFAVYYKKGSGSYTTLQSFSSNTSVNFTPTSSGTYTIMVTASDYRNVTTSKTFTVTVTAPELVNNSTISAATVNTGDNITVTGKATGGEGSYSYKVTYQKKDALYWNIVQSYSSNNSVSFSIDTAGEYTVCVDVTDGNSTVTSKYFDVTVKEPLTNNSTISATTVKVGEEITVNAAASGGEGSYTYCAAYVDEGQNSVVVQNYTSNNIISFSINNAGEYTVYVIVKDSNGNVSEKSFDITVEQKDELVNNSGMSSDSITLGDTVTLTGAAAGGTAPYKYAYYYKNSTDSKYTTLKGYSTTDTVSFTPTETGTYSVVIYTKDNDGTIMKKTFKLTVKNVALVNNSKLSADSINLGGTVTITGEAAGGTAPYKYAYYYKKSTDSSYTTIKGFSETSTVSLEPTEAGSYIVVVKVKDNAGTIARSEYTLTVANAALANNSELSSEKIALGGTVTITGEAAGGTAPYQYAVYYKNSTDSKFSTLQTYSAANTVTFQPTETGTYSVVVYVKDNNGATVKKTMKLTVENALTNTSELSSEKIALGGTVTITGKATGGTAPYQYAVYYKNSTDSKFSTLQTYSATDTVTFKPTATGTYSVVVYVKDNDGTTVKKTMKLTVEDAALTNTSKLAAASIALGSSVKIKGSATGGTAPYQYAFYYKNSTDSKFTTLKSYSSTATVSFKPTAAGTYSVVVYVKDNDGTIVKKTLKLTVTE